MWYLAWAGEVTCDTYACLRHSHFSVSLSACYDLDSTPWKIAQGRMSADRVLKQMQRRKLDARLGRWSATERLAPPSHPLERKEIVRRWARQLLDRWGIVTREMLQAEVAAPSWAELAPEFKRLELMGSVQRGYFIDGHAGEQYGMPKAIELLRDSRARRGEEHHHGLLRGEPIWSISNRDPANLYASCLDCRDERGEVYAHGARHGNFICRLIVQAGQVLLLNSTQLVTLPRAAVRKCCELLIADMAGSEERLIFGHWNDNALDHSPVAPILWDLGCRLNSRREMVYPGKGNGERPPDTGQELFPAYFNNAASLAFNPSTVATRAAAHLQPTIERLLTLAVAEFARRGWEIGWHPYGVTATYRKVGHLGIYLARSFAHIRVSTRAVRIGAERLRMVAWDQGNQLRVTRAEDMNDDFLAAFRGLLARAEEIAERYLDGKGKK